MRSAKKVGHGTVKLDKKMSARIRKAMPAQDIVFVPEIVESEDTTMAEIRLDVLATERVKSLRGVFGDGPRYVEKPIHELRGKNVRFVDDGDNVTLYFGVDFCKAVFGQHPQNMRQTVLFQVEDNIMRASLTITAPLNTETTKKERRRRE